MRIARGPEAATPANPLGSFLPVPASSAPGAPLSGCSQVFQASGPISVPAHAPRSGGDWWVAKKKLIRGGKESGLSCHARPFYSSPHAASLPHSHTTLETRASSPSTRAHGVHHPPRCLPARGCVRSGAGAVLLTSRPAGAVEREAGAREPGNAVDVDPSVARLLLVGPPPV